MEIKKFTEILKQGFAAFTFDFSYDYATNRKIFKFPTGYNTFTNHQTAYNENNTGLAIRTGYEYMRGRYLILIDIDNKYSEIDGNIEYNGMDLLNIWLNIDKSINKTSYEKTQSDGRHYYFYVDEEQKKYLTTSQTLTKYKDKIYKVDYKFERQCAVVSPSFFYKSGIKISYSWLNGCLRRDNIIKLPDCIYECIKLTDNHKIKNTNKGDFININEINEEQTKDFKISASLEDIQKYLTYINGYDTYDKWRNVGYVLKNLNINSFEIYDKWSKQSEKYDKISIVKQWKAHKPNNNISISALKYWVKEDKMEGYEKIIVTDEDKNIFEPIKLKTRYLTDNEEVNEIVNNWIIDDEHKFLSIKSPYDTGKTTLIKKILDDYPEQTQNTLYITYRQTLARNICSNFKKWNFENYLDKKFNGNNQIIQLDSIEKIDGTYDFIIIDEIESILAHLTAGTIKNKSYGNMENIHKKLCDIICNSSKVLSLDGDYGNRAHIFLSSFNKKISVIENIEKINIKNFNIYHNVGTFNEIMNNQLLDNKKIVICCMSANTVDNYKNDLMEKHPKLNILSYTSKTSDDIKNEDFNNISTSWLADVLIYSPTVESGVDFNEKNYDSLFIIYSNFSTCPRGLNQMINRVRKFNNDNVHVLLKGAPTSNILYNIDDIFNNYKSITHKNNLNNFDIIYCYNLLETLRSEKNFSSVFLEMLHKKGHKIIFNKNIEEKQNKPKLTQKEINDIQEKKKLNKSSYKISIADDITNEYFNTLINKQKNNNLSENEKYQLEKHIYKLKLGLDKLDYDILENFYKKLFLFDNYLCIVDIKNIKNYYQNEVKTTYDLEKEIKKCELVNNIIKCLGFSHCNDDKQIESEIFDENLKKTYDLVNEYNKICMISKEDIISKKAMKGSIKSILNTYCINIKQERKQKKIKGKIYDEKTYYLERLYDIEKYVKNRISKGLIINDCNNIFI